MQQSDVYYQQCLNMFRTSLCPSSGEQRPCVIACGVLRWFCWVWLVAVVGRCFVGCEHCEGYCSLSLHNWLKTHGHKNLKHQSIQSMSCLRFEYRKSAYLATYSRPSTNCVQQILKNLIHSSKKDSQDLQLIPHLLLSQR